MEFIFTNSKIASICVLVIAVGACSCKLSSFTHDPVRGAHVAVCLANQEIVNGNYDTKLFESSHRLREVIETIHPDDFMVPEHISAGRYQKLPGTPNMFVFLVGIRDDRESVFYRFTLSLQSNGDYLVTKIERNPDDKSYTQTQFQYPLPYYVNACEP